MGNNVKDYRGGLNWRLIFAAQWDNVEHMGKRLLLLFILGALVIGAGRAALLGDDFGQASGVPIEPGTLEARPTEQIDPAPSKTPSYKADIQPLFQAKCIRCHGGKKQKAELDLSTPAGVLKGGESGRAIAPGNPKQSILFEKIHNGKMPPDEDERLSTAQIDLVRAWIAAGAKVDVEVVEAVTQHDVIPIMLRRCTVCHGRHRKEAGLDLRTKAAMLRGGKSGPAIVPGKPDESRLVKQVRSGKMPPPDRLVEVSGKPIEPVCPRVLGCL